MKHSEATNMRSTAIKNGSATHTQNDLRSQLNYQDGIWTLTISKQGLPPTGQEVFDFRDALQVPNRGIEVYHSVTIRWRTPPALHQATFAEPAPPPTSYDQAA